MTIDLTLDGLRVPAIDGYNPPFGHKIERTELNRGGLSTREVNENMMMPFTLMRPRTITADSTTTDVEYDAKLVFAQQLTEGVTLTMGDAAYEGCEITVSNLSEFACALAHGTWAFSVPSGLSTKVYWKSGRWRARLDDEKPVGFLYESFDPTDPGTLFGGTWVRLPDGVFIRNVGGDAGTVGQVQTEGLPNLSGYFGHIAISKDGTFTDGSLFSTQQDLQADWTGTSQQRRDYMKIKFDAHNYNTIYGSSDHVTPYNMAVYMWRRVPDNTLAIENNLEENNDEYN